jgi:hypothetical protein
MSEQASFPIPFAIGQQVWHATRNTREHYETCPDCVGTRVLTIILGNGEEFEIPCSACSYGYEPATGKVKRTVCEWMPIPFTCRRVNISGDTIYYSEAGPEANCYTSAYAENLFADRAECEARCKVQQEQQVEEEAKHAGDHLLSKRKKLASSIDYWRSRKRDLERDLAWVNERLKTCAPRAPRKKKEAPSAG